MAKAMASEVHARLRLTFASGVSRPLEWRLNALDSLAEMLNRNWNAMVQALADDLGRPKAEADAELANAAREIADLRASLRRWIKPERTSTHLLLLPAASEVRRSPYGAVLVLAPFNYPAMLALAPLAGVLAAGNVACLKMSELTPACSALFARIVPEHFAPSALSVVEGGVAETTELLALQWDFIVFTGSPRVGKIVHAAAARHMTPVLLECGGKCPTIVDETVSSVREAALRIASTKFVNASQTCVAPDTVIVHESVHTELVSALRDVIRDSFGDEPVGSAEFGRLCTPAHHTRALELLATCGGTVHTAGSAPADAASKYIPPTIVDAPSEGSRLLAEEVFAPILIVVPVGSLDEAIAVSNRVDPTPLALYFFGSAERGERVVSRTQSGAFVANDCIVHQLNHSLPFGGVGTSGLGHYHGRWSWETFTYARACVWRHGVLDIDQTLPFPVRYAAAHMSASASQRRLWLLRQLFLRAPYVSLPRPSASTLAACALTYLVTRFLL